MIVLALMACGPSEPEPAAPRVEPTRLAPAHTWVRALTTDATHVYWTSYDNRSGKSDRATLERVPIAGGPVETVAVEGHPPEHLAVHGGFLYWSYGHGSLKRVPVTGGEPELLATDAADCFWVDDRGIVFMREVKILTLDPATREERVVVEKSLGVCPVAIGDQVYWAERMGIYRAPRDGGAPEKVAALKKTEALHVDGDDLLACYDDRVTRIDSRTGEHSWIRSFCKGDTLAVSEHGHWITQDNFVGWPPVKHARLVEITRDGPSYLFEGLGASHPTVQDDDLIWAGADTEGVWSIYRAPVPVGAP